MALTLIEAQKLSTDVLQAGVIETIAQESAVLQRLPFMEIVGNSYAYNLEDKLPEVAFRGVNEAYTASEATFVQRSEKLVILGGDIELDRFLIQTLSNVNDQVAVQIMEKAKAMANTFTKNFFKGDVAKDPKGFDGLDKRIAGTAQEITSAAADNAAILDELNVLLDTVKGGADVLYMNRQSRRKLLSVMQASQHYIENGQDAFGRQVSMYGGVPIMVIDDLILPTDGTAHTTDVYAVKFGAHTHVTGLQNGGISVRKLGETSAKAVEVTRIEWFVAMAMFNPYSAARLKGLKVA
ncbi:major capsid protein [Bacillus toyonensis]|uniref:major capsid protein n=1 Tax=Bacillus toyonensis TaxID=155322 RepID=UPI000BF228BF|nr:phage major capsid protein [Bacillus toyonensis]PEL24312.1 phage major capsid protein [Bacillus toyonensis]